MMTIFHNGQLPDENKKGFDLDKLMVCAMTFFAFALAFAIIIRL